MILTVETQQKLFLAGTEQIPVPLVYLSYPDQTIVYANRSALDFFKYQYGEITGISVCELFSPLSFGVEEEEDRDRIIREQISDFVDSSSLSYSEEVGVMIWTRRRASIPAEYQLISVKVDEAEYVAVVFRDKSKDELLNTELRQRANEVQSFKQQLKAQKQEQERQDLKHQSSLKKNQAMLMVIYFMGGMAIFVYVLPMGVSIFRRVPEQYFSLARDAMMLILSSVAGVMGSMFGYGQRGREEAETSKEPEKASAKE